MTARLRFPAERSRLRRYPEPEESESYRGPFQRDRDRIVHSRAFRRLADKTQVATLPTSNHCRTRLTHTIEVAQLSRTVATALGLNVDLVEALALAHDLGHPPFGHVGEAALDDEMRRHGLSFDHNSHGLRVVEHFERRYAAFRGLNLTFEVREGLVKHSREIDPDDSRFREYLPGLRPPLEAQLIDPADEVAYLSADLEDAVEGGFLEPAAVCESVPEFAELHVRVRTAYPAVNAKRALSETQRRFVGTLVQALVDGTREAAEASGAEDCEDVRRLPGRIAKPAAEAQETMLALREILSETYYNAAALERAASGYVSKLRDLFRYYLEHPEALPDSTAAELGRQPLPRLVCDYIAGMTDTFLLRCHRDLLGLQRPEELQNALA